MKWTTRMERQWKNVLLPVEEEKLDKLITITQV